MSSYESKGVPAPEKLRQLRACIKCRLIKTVSAWRATTCENCPSTQGLDYMSFTSPLFRGMCAMIAPQASWVARWQKQAFKEKGLYAMQVIGTMSSEFDEEEEGRISGKSGRMQDEEEQQEDRDFIANEDEEEEAPMRDDDDEAEARRAAVSRRSKAAAKSQQERRPARQREAEDEEEMVEPQYNEGDDDELQNMVSGQAQSHDRTAGPNNEEEEDDE